MTIWLAWSGETIKGEGRLYGGSDAATTLFFCSLHSAPHSSCVEGVGDQPESDIRIIPLFFVNILYKIGRRPFALYK